MKSHKYWSIGALITMLGTFYTGYKGSKEGMAGMSSKPTKLTSCGIRMPCSCSARDTPTAWLSFAHTMHVGIYSQA